MKHRYFATKYIAEYKDWLAPKEGGDNRSRLAPAGQPLPYPPEDQSQEQDRHPLTYDYNCHGTVIVIHAHSSPGEAVTWMPFVARSEEIVGEV